MNRAVLPEVRRRTALILKEHGMGQNAIAEALQVTQAMVSRYMKAGEKRLGASMDAQARRLSEELAGGILAGKSRPELIEAFCRSCMRMRESGSFCEIHPVRDCRVCMNIRGSGGAGERSGAIRDVEQAVSMLAAINPSLIPEVRVNIARAVDGAEGINDVVAIPGRMVEIKGKLVALIRPEFGASRHLSGTLLSVMKERKDVRAVINILFTEEIGAAIKVANMESSVIIDRGAFGREPCVYVLGRSAVEVSAKVMSLSEMVE